MALNKLAEQIDIRYFKNADNAPLVILATGDVTISGTIDVSGFYCSTFGMRYRLGSLGRPMNSAMPSAASWMRVSA